MHPTKCKAQTNDETWCRRGSISVEEGLSIEVLSPDEGLKILGTKLTLKDYTTAELQNRISSAWRLFWSLKPTLLNKHVSVKRRLSLFDSTVGSCALWGTESWIPRADQLRELESARRSMLRRVVGSPRGVWEDWIPWMQRATHRALDLAAEVGIRSWADAHFALKWSWAGQVACSFEASWIKKVTEWRD